MPEITNQVKQWTASRHRSTNAARAAYPNPAGLVEVLHIVFIPSAAQAKAAAIRRCGRSQALPYTNELPQLLPGVRGLTTPFRSDGQMTLPCLQCRLLAPLQSVVRSPNRTSNTIAERLHENKGLLCRQSVVPSLTHKTPITLTYAANNSSRTP